MEEERHPLEDLQSWDLFQQRQQQQQQQLVDDGEGEDTNADADAGGEHGRQLWGDIAHPLYSTRPANKKKHKKAPKPDGDSAHAMLIDAGSQGTRIHIYEYARRLLESRDDILASANGEKLSFPTTNSRWTNKFTPGLDSLAKYEDDDELVKQLKVYLEPFLDFAKTVLLTKGTHWKDFPIYLKATGGMRTLPTAPRIRLMEAVRSIFHDKKFSPFSFEDERARVISGEEEAIYGWAAVNFVKGSLIETSLGTGTVSKPEKTIGMVEMGGASTQIGLFINSGDVMANLFKLQIGAARHWNVYVHSFLYFGVNSAWQRLNAQLAWKNTAFNPCLPSGSAVNFDSWLHLNADAQFLPRSSPLSTPYSITMMNNIRIKENNGGGVVDTFDQCSQLAYSLLRKEANKEWVVFSHDGDCSFAGVYQPPLPKSDKDIDEYVATGNYADVFAFLKLGSHTSVSAINEAAKLVCAMSWEELKVYNKKLSGPIEDPFELAQYCFRSVFAFQMLRKGYGFDDDSQLTAVDVLNGQKVNWALGSILYEINTLPWEFHKKLKVKEPSKKSKWSLLALTPSSVTGHHGESHGTIDDATAGAVDNPMAWTIICSVLATLAMVSVVSSFQQRWQNRQRRQHYEALDTNDITLA